MRRRLLLVGALALGATGCGGGAHAQSSTSVPARTTPAPTSTALAGSATSTTSSATSTTSTTTRRRPPFAVGERVLTFVDDSRSVKFPGRAPQARTLVTLIRYPAVGRWWRDDLRGAAPARAGGPFPLVIFGHGFAVTPAPYAALLRAWARAGYVVAAPIFPLENANAPGGPDENDLVNQPADMSFLITRMLAEDRDPASFLHDLIDPRQIAVSGQSDGGETALATAYDAAYLDRRVRAAIILSGAEIPNSGLYFTAQSPPLFASQGTADTINPPSFTYQFYDIAPRPKYLLKLDGAPHLPPYTYEQPQLRIVERATIAFMDHFLKRIPDALARMFAAGDVPGIASVQGG